MDWTSDMCSSDLTRRIGEEERMLVDARAGATADMNRADLCDATANLGAELLAQIFLRDRAGSNAHRGLARTRSAATAVIANRSEEHTSELQSLMRISYAVFCLKKKMRKITH